jgi:hypothetical protein
MTEHKGDVFNRIGQFRSFDKMVKIVDNRSAPAFGTKRFPIGATSGERYAKQPGLAQHVGELRMLGFPPHNRLGRVLKVSPLEETRP